MAITGRRLRPWTLVPVLCFSLTLAGRPTPFKAPLATAKALSGPAAAAKVFDSLLEAGNLPEARARCTGQVLRMFDFLAMAQSKMTGLIDTVKSTDTTLEEKTAGNWAYLKVSSHVVFIRPLLGQTEMQAFQAMHLYHAPQGWLVAEMEELAGPQAQVRMRSGPPDPGSPGEKSASLFPVSEQAPAKAGEIDRMQYRLRLKNGGSLSPFCVLGPEQRLLRTEPDSAWVLENRRPKLPLPPAGSNANPVLQAALHAQFKTYLASNAFLQLEDSLLIATAADIIGSETDPTRMTERIYLWVTKHLEFKLGAVLFGTSGEVLRNLTGDCSEAAILTAALLRVRGIPSRLAFGFASLGRGVFIGHAWCEAYLGQEWIGVDAALRQFPAGVERVKLAELDGQGDLRVAATNLMITVLSNLEIEILSAWKDGKPVPLQKFPGNAGEGLEFFQQILKGMDEP